VLQFVGHNDEVLDVRFWGQDDQQIAVATNSPLIKVFDVDTWACQILVGHTDNVVAIDTYQKGHTSLLVSGSKVGMQAYYCIFLPVHLNMQNQVKIYMIIVTIYDDKVQDIFRNITLT
jgi:WD40 repeat protein